MCIPTKSVKTQTKENITGMVRNKELVNVLTVKLLQYKASASNQSPLHTSEMTMLNKEKKIKGASLPD